MSMKRWRKSETKMRGDQRLAPFAHASHGVVGSIHCMGMDDPPTSTSGSLL